MTPATRVVVGFAAGGSSDVFARKVANRLQPGYARSAIVENKPGAGGQLAVQYMKTLPTDGSAFLLTPMSMLGIYPHTYKKLPYDPVADVIPVSQGCYFDFGLAVGPAVPSSITSIGEFLAWAKAAPGRSSFGTGSNGSSVHFIGVLVGRSAGVQMTHLAYRGTQLAVADVIGGTLPMVIGPLGDLLPHVASGRCRLLATTSATRSRFAPTVPSLVEQGLKDMAFREWFGFFMPPNTPPATLQLANQAMQAALTAPELIEECKPYALEPRPSAPVELATLLKQDTERWRLIVKSVGFTSES